MKQNQMEKNPPMEMSHYKKPYSKLLVMLVLSFMSMYILMYALENINFNALPSVNQLYMASLMTMPMMIIELTMMRKMYPNRNLNLVLLFLSLLGLIGFFLLIQNQTAVTDRQFMKGVSPHHAAAILMIEHPISQDPEIKIMQQDLIISHREVIKVMKAKLKAIDK